MVHSTDDPMIPEPEIPIELDRQRRIPSFLRPFLLPRSLSRPPLDSSPSHSELRASYPSAPDQRAGPAFASPGDGADVTVGVLIALPAEQGRGRGADEWEVEEDRDAEMPEVCLGVIDCRVNGEA